MSTHIDNLNQPFTEADQPALAARIRQIALTTASSFPATLDLVERINALLWQTLWQDETLQPNELQVSDIIQRLGEVQSFAFAPWLHNCLQQELTQIAAIHDDSECIHYASAVVMTLNGIAHQMFDSETYEQEPADGMPQDKDHFEAWWPLAIKMTLEMSTAADDDEEDEDEGSDEFNEAQLAFIEMSPLAKTNFLAERLASYGLNVSELKAKTIKELKKLDDDDYFDFSEAFRNLLPERTFDFCVEPFDCYSEDELRSFYPDLWTAASEATGGELKLQNLTVEILGEDEEEDEDEDEDDYDDESEKEIIVSFTAFGKQHTWTYIFDGSYSDTSFLEHLTEFAEQYLPGRFLVDGQNDSYVGCLYLPADAAAEIDLYLQTA
jgi:hypothetical protein